MNDLCWEALMAVLFLVGFIAFVLWFGCTNQAAHFYSDYGNAVLQPKSTSLIDVIRYIIN